MNTHIRTALIGAAVGALLGADFGNALEISTSPHLSGGGPMLFGGHKLRISGTIPTAAVFALVGWFLGKRASVVFVRRNNEKMKDGWPERSRMRIAIISALVSAVIVSAFLLVLPARFIEPPKEPFLFKEPFKLAGVGVLGSVAGHWAAAASGYTAIGVVGGGAGAGAAFGPVGAVAGGVIGLALYAVYQESKGPLSSAALRLNSWTKERFSDVLRQM